MNTALLAKKAVARGAKLLDERVPGWAARIDLAYLSLGSPDCCVLGQLFRGRAQEYGLSRGVLDVSTLSSASGWRIGKAVLFGNINDPKAATHGFGAAWSEEHDEWVQAVMGRRGEEVQI